MPTSARLMGISYLCRVNAGIDSLQSDNLLGVRWALHVRTASVSGSLFYQVLDVCIFKGKSVGNVFAGQFSLIGIDAGKNHGIP